MNENRLLDRNYCYRLSVVIAGRVKFVGIQPIYTKSLSLFRDRLTSCYDNKKVTVDKKVTIEMHSRLSGGWESTYMSG